MILYSSTSRPATHFTLLWHVYKQTTNEACMIGCINIGQLVVTANENYQMVNKKEKTKGGLTSFIDQN